MGFWRLKLLTNLGFSLLVSWWLVLNLHNLKNSLGNTYFSLGIAVYAIGLGLLLSSEIMNSKVNKNRFFGLFVCLSTVFYGIGNFIWFLFDYSNAVMVPFPSLADIFYVVHFPLIIASVFMLGGDLFGKDFIKNLFVMGSFVTLFVFSLALYLKGFDLGLEQFLIFYYPTQSFIVLCLLVYNVLKQKLNLKLGLIVFIFAQFTWFLGDIFFFYMIDFADFLYLFSVFMNYFSVLKLIDNSDSGGAFSEDGLSLLKSVTYIIPTSLN